MCVKLLGKMKVKSSRIEELRDCLVVSKMSQIWDSRMAKMVVKDEDMGQTAAHTWHSERRLVGNWT